MNLKIKGLREVERKLDELARKAKALDGTNHVPLTDMFPPTFMQKYTSFETLEAMLTAGGFTAGTQEEWDAIPQEQLDAFVAQHSRFGSWQEMLNTGGTEWASRQLGFK